MALILASGLLPLTELIEGFRYDADTGGVIHCWADKEEPFNFPSKGKLLTFDAVKHKLESLETDKQVTTKLLVD